MSIKEIFKSGTFVIVLLVLVAIGLPFAVEQVGDASGLFIFPATKWVKGLFSSSGGRKSVSAAAKTVKWEEQLKDLKAFSDWADGLVEAKIAIVRPVVFEIKRKKGQGTITDKKCSWTLQALSGNTNVNATQVRDKLKLFCDPADKVSGRIASVEACSEGFRVTVDELSGEGKIGLSYDGSVPVYYDVKLRRMWLVPVASCRSAMKGRYDSAVFFPGMERGLPEGAVISPSNDKCGYRILSISDHCVWFEAFYGDTPPEDILPHSVWPDFSRVDTMSPTPPPGRLIFGRSRCFWPGDAIKLPNSGSYLSVDDFLAGRAVVFRLLDSSFHPVRDLLCVIVREK